MARSGFGHGPVDHGSIAPSVSSLVALDGRGRGLELIFQVRAGRCVHRLVAIAGTRRADLLESVEGEAQDRWPPSPPWQQVSAWSGSGGAKLQRTALLTGAAGVSHWSASVEANHGPALEGRGQPPSPGLRFDVACRAKNRPARLESTYRLADRAQAGSGCSGSGESVLDLRTVLGKYQLRVLPVESTQSDLHQRGIDSCQLIVARGLVRMVVPSVGADDKPTTYRWRYQIRLVE